MAKATTKAAIEKELTPQERVDLFAKGVQELSQKYQIGLVPVQKPDFQFVDLLKQNGTKESEPEVK